MGQSAEDPRHKIITSSTKTWRVADSSMRAKRLPFTKTAFAPAPKKVSPGKPSKPTRR